MKELIRAELSVRNAADIVRCPYAFNIEKCMYVYCLATWNVSSSTHKLSSVLSVSIACCQLRLFVGGRHTFAQSIAKDCFSVLDPLLIQPLQLISQLTHKKRNTLTHIYSNMVAKRG